MSTPNPLKSMFFYHLRIDAPDNPETHIHLGEWLFLNSVHMYHCIFEVSKKGKDHWHCFLVFGEKLLKKDIMRMRNWWLSKTDDTYQPLSFKAAKDVAGLWSYINKSQPTLTGMLSSELSNIDNNSAMFFKTFESKLERKEKKKSLLMNNLQQSITEYMTFDAFCHLYMDEYHKVYATYPRFRIQFYSTALTLGIIDKLQYFKSINLDIFLQHDKPNNYAQIVSSNDCLQSEIKLLKSQLNNFKLSNPPAA